MSPLKNWPIKVLGIIPARGGSKGIPGKNKKILGQKPLVAYTIEAGLESTLIQDLIVSTDDEEIAKIARSLGAEVPFMRPSHLATDTSPTIDTVAHLIQRLEESGRKYDAVCLLQPSVPFRTIGLIDECIRMFISAESESLITTREVPHKFNPHWIFEEDDTEGRLRLATGEIQIITRRQELPKAFFRDGSVYLTRTETIQKKESLYGDSIAYVLNANSPEINIDLPEDWERAETYLRDGG